VLPLAGIRSLAEYKREVGALAAVAVIGVLVLAAAAVYFFPSNTGTSIPSPHGTATAASSTQTFPGSTTLPMMLTTTSVSISLGSTFSTIGLSSTTTYIPPAENTTTIGATSPQWDAAPAVNLTLYSPLVQTIIKSAYSYSVDCCTSSSSLQSNNTSIYLAIYVVGSQAVSGNWTSRYLVTQSGVEMLAATVRYTEPASYQLASVNITSLSGQNYTISYTPLQQEVIRAAISNGSVNNYIDDDGLPPYYVGNVTAFGGGNLTYAGDYFLTLLQVNGPKFLGVYVNSTTMQVVKVYEDSMAYSMCYYPGGICFSSPWNSLTEQNANQTSTSVMTITTTSILGNQSSVQTSR